MSGGSGDREAGTSGWLEVRTAGVSGGMEAGTAGASGVNGEHTAGASGGRGGHRNGVADVDGGLERETEGRLALAALALVTLLPALGTSIANVALPTLAETFGASFQAVQWVVLAYLLATTALVVSVGGLRLLQAVAA